MKRKSLILSCMLIFCMVAGVFTANAADYNFELVATTDENGENAEVTFAPGSYLYLNVNLKADSGGVAGCAFTLTYDSTKLDAPDPATDPANLPDGPTTTAITSDFDFRTTADNKYTRCENSSTAGEIKFAGAEIDDSTGGSKIHYYDVTLFRVRFMVKDTATGDIVFSLKETELYNADAGWNGEKAPVIVGAIGKDAACGDSWKYAHTCVDGFGGDLTDDFPVLLDVFSVANPAPTLTVKSSATNAYEDWKAANGYDIGGPMEDDDYDGLTNGEEFNEGVDSTDPTNQGDPVADTTGIDVTDPVTWPLATYPDYDAKSDFRVSNLDIDGNGLVQLEYDAILLFRRLSEIDAMYDYFGDKFEDGAISPPDSEHPATRTDPTKLRAYIDLISGIDPVNGTSLFDIDASGAPLLEQDGILITRRLSERDAMYDFLGDKFEDGAIDEDNAERREPQELRDYIDLLFPQ